jgi:hypothetical protein
LGKEAKILGFIFKVFRSGMEGCRDCIFVRVGHDAGWYWGN